jgi:hypothetical protein
VIEDMKVKIKETLTIEEIFPNTFAWKNEKGEIHNDYGAAVFNTETGSQGFYRNGLRHRVDLPAIIDSHGVEYWLNGERHRDGGPAIISKIGIHSWYQHGVMYNPNGPCYVSEDGKSKFWHNEKGRIHNDFGPSVINEHEMCWTKDGVYHNENGPALIQITPDGKRLVKWYIGGISYPETEYFEKIKEINRRRDGSFILNIID